jgi:tRNA G10  N-methylase Trm11
MQPALFPISEINKTCEQTQDYLEIYEENQLSYDFADIQEVTFKGGLNEPVDYLDCNENHLLLEPFAGKGTTLIETQKLNISSIGIEINPLLQSVSEKCLSWHHEIEALQKILQNIETQYFEIRKKANTDFETFCQKYKLEVPPIHNVFRWWQEDVLKDLLLLKKLVYQVEEKHLNPFWTALSSVCLDCANIHRNHPTISFDDKHKRKIDVWREFSEKTNRIFCDLKEVSKAELKNLSKVFLGDSTKIEEILTTEKIDRIITSPPYPNRFSYIHTTRPQLFFMDVIKDAKTATDIDIDAIGGTWGRATSILDKEFLQPNAEIRNILQVFINELQPKSLLMCNYAIKYFNLMHNHIKSVKSFLSENFKGVYVVGNSRLYGVEIHTEIILAKIFEREGFKVDKIMMFRKRGGKSKLFETGVCVSI